MDGEDDAAGRTDGIAGASATGTLGPRFPAPPPHGATGR